MKIDGFDMASNALAQDLILKVVQGMFIVSYGIITDASKNPFVTVNVLASSGREPPTVCARYVSLTSLLLELSIVPSAGDHVLLLSPKDWTGGMLTATEPSQGTAGYKPNLCLAFPAGTVRSASVSTVDITGSSVTIGIGNPTTDSSGTKTEHTVDVPVKVSGNASLNAASIDLNGGDDKDDNLIRYSELNTALQNFVTGLQTCMTTTPIAGEGATQPTWVNFPSLDISKAKCSTLTTGKTDPST